jgi:glycosyltransferase involved in cell wall biosynthesis
VSDPLLSVTIANYNYARYLGQNIESILSQTFEDYEIILIDNASSDESLEVMQRYAAIDPRIRVVAHPHNEGMFASYRESSDLSRGRYRVPIEADDWMLAPDAFEVQVDMLERNPSMSFVYSAMTLIRSDGQQYYVSHSYPSDVVLSGAEALEGILSFGLTHTGMMMRLDSYRAGEGYTEGYPHVADMWLGVRLCEVGDVGYLARQLYAFRQHETNLSREPQTDVIRQEVLPMIDAAFDGPLGARLPDRSAVRRRVLRRALVHHPTQHIFTGDRRSGWQHYWNSCKAHPVYTVLQPRTLSLISRSVLGYRGHRWLTARLRPSPHRVVDDPQPTAERPAPTSAACEHGPTQFDP